MVFDVSRNFQLSETQISCKKIIYEIVDIRDKYNELLQINIYPAITNEIYFFMFYSNVDIMDLMPLYVKIFAY